MKQPIETQKNKNVSGRPIICIILSDRIIMKYGDHTCQIIHKYSIRMQYIGYYHLIFASICHYILDTHTSICMECVSNHYKPLSQSRNVSFESICTLGYPFDPPIRWNIVVSRFHLIDGFQIGWCDPFFQAQGYLYTRSIGFGTYCLSLVYSILPIDLVHSSRWTRSLFYTSLELPI